MTQRCLALDSTLNDELVVALRWLSLGFGRDSNELSGKTNRAVNS